MWETTHEVFHIIVTSWFHTFRYLFGDCYVLLIYHFTVGVITAPSSDPYGDRPTCCSGKIMEPKGEFSSKPCLTTEVRDGIRMK